jgi:dolichol kinase
MDHDPESQGPAFDALVARTEGLQPWRRVFHAVSGIVLALVPGWSGLSYGTVAIVLGVSTAVLFAADWVRLAVPSLNRLFFMSFRLLASPREAGAVASSSWYALGATLVWAFTPGWPAVAALLVLGLADPAASVMGRAFGRRPLGKGTRLGSLVFFSVATAILVPFVGWAPALGTAVIVALVEIMPWGVDDNLTVPVATAAMLWLLAPGITG